MCRLPGMASFAWGSDVTENAFFECSKSFSVSEIATLTGAVPREGADLARRISNIAPVDRAGATDLTFVEGAAFAAALMSTKAGAVLTNDRYARRAPSGLTVLQVSKPVLRLRHDRTCVLSRRASPRPRCSARMASRRVHLFIPRRGWGAKLQSIQVQ